MTRVWLVAALLLLSACTTSRGVLEQCYVAP